MRIALIGIEARRDRISSAESRREMPLVKPPFGQLQSDHLARCCHCGCPFAAPYPHQRQWRRDRTCSKGCELSFDRRVWTHDDRRGAAASRAPPALHWLVCNQ